MLFGGTTALFFLRDKASVSPGATVTAVTSARNADLVRSLGARHLIDHAAVDITTIDDRFDVVIDTVGNVSIPTGRRLLTPSGVLLLVAAGLGDNVKARGEVRAGMTPERPEDFEQLLEMVERGELRVVTDDVLGLDRITEAHRRVDSGRKVGNLIIHP